MAALSRKVSSTFNTLRPLVCAVHAQGLHSDAPLSSATVPVSKPVGHTTATLIPGDGVGPELCQVVLDVFRNAGVPVNFEEHYVTEFYGSKSDNINDVVESIRPNGICLKGILATPDYSSDGELKTHNMKLRDELDLFVNVVHVMSLNGLSFRHKNVDMVVIREQLEGEYSALEHESVAVVDCLQIMTREKCRRIAKFAFDYATKYERKRVTAVHKDNIIKLGDGLFLRQCEEVAAMYPHIKFSNMIIDNCTMQLVSNPHQFDVLVLPNLYGNIVDNLAAGLVGGAGVVAGASYSSNAVVFEPGAHHTFCEAVGNNVANPTAMLLASENLLNHISLQYYGDL
ncbi:isocitrate dehydrogenase [NAD] subunit beta, mitochondrial-like [Panulirus ornatus]|uniref:isocitrate dehydrogenase [NAD] subunit beta, mitochondrial-like n=1 Tax=Panulirus ornatus TaxID=150431 RepID=UPI003A880D5D